MSDTVGHISFSPCPVPIGWVTSHRRRKELALIETWQARAIRFEALSETLRAKGNHKSADNLLLLADSARMAAEELAAL